MMKPDVLLYLTVKSSVQGQWFKAQVMGVEKRNSFRKDICKAVEFPQKQTTPGEKLQDNDVPPNHIIQITGDKNLQAINNYGSLSRTRNGIDFKHSVNHSVD